MFLTLLILPCLVFIHKASAQYPAAQSKAILVKRVIELNHYSPRAIDDSFSMKLFKAVINAADSRRLVFTNNEIKTLSSYSFKLDDELNGNGWGFLDLFTSLYKKSLTRADSIVTAALQKPIDFTVNETVTASRDNSWSFAANSSELYAKWNRYLKFTELNNLYDIISDDSTTDGFSKEAIAKREAAVRDKLKTKEKNKIKAELQPPSGIEKSVMNMYLNSIAISFDPHTEYFSQEGKEEFQSALSTEGYSFGLDFDEDEKGKIVIDHLIPGGPAWKSGELNTGDELLQLYWEGKEPAEASNLSIEEVYAVLEQPSELRLVVKVKKADNSVKTVMLRKEKISNEENIVRSFVLKGEKKIGYILLPGFYTQWENESGSGCANDVAKEIIKLKRENIDGLILDVRFNGGGSIYEGLELTGIFVDEGPLAGEKDKTGKVLYYKDPNRGVIYSGPLVLMVNGQSASASEMLAASLQDYNRAVVVGSKTYGKASMQQLFPLDTTYRPNTPMPNTATDVIKITLGKFYRLDGHSTQLKGVSPDVVLPDAFDGLEIGERFELNVLSSDTVKRNAYYKPLPSLPVTELAKRSADRVAKDDDFKNIKKLLEMQTELRQARSAIIPLKWDEFDKWMKKNGVDIDYEGAKESSGHWAEISNNQVDKQWLQNNEYDREINKQWLENIGDDIYVREAFFIVSDLINLQKTSTKN